jgi:hypothetical protein
MAPPLHWQADMIPTHGIDLTASLSPAPVLLVMLLVSAILVFAALGTRRPRRLTNSKQARLAVAGAR